jgi:CRISPR-associated protein Csx3
MSQEPIQPAVLIGGPPHAGKSVLTYSLTRALRQYGIEHYVMRACPDGEGHWSQEAPRQVAEAIRRSHKGTYSDEFVRRVCADIQQRQLPFIVDVGGLPQGEQFQIFQCCTHAILLLHRQPAERDWHSIVERNHLRLLADLTSELDGISILETRDPVLRGTLTGLQRNSTTQGEPFDSLVECLISLFRETAQGLSAFHTSKAPINVVLNLPQMLDSIAPGRLDWTPEMLPRLLAEVPLHTPLAVYGRAAHWVYTALALHTRPAPFYQFDARLSWLEPLTIQAGAGIHAEIMFESEVREQFTILHSHLRTPNLEYGQLGNLNAPELSVGKGLIINGKLPLWLASSLAIFYQQAGIPWIAGYYPQKQGAVVVSSGVPGYSPGDFIPIALNNHNY